MPQFVVEADGYSIEFLERNGLTYRNIRLIPLGDHWDIIRTAKRERMHYKTCIAEVNIDGENSKDALDKCQKILNELSFYLAFAFSQQDFFQNFNCYKNEDGTKKLVNYVRFGSMYVGRMIGGANIYSGGIQRFIDNGFSNFLSVDFNERTGLRTAILWYNLGLDYNMQEVRFASHFVALEVLASCFAGRNPIEPRLSDVVYSKLKIKLKDIYQELGITEWEDIHASICNEVRRVSIKEKISALLISEGLGQYENVAHDFVYLRNKIFHEGSAEVAEEYGGWSTVLSQIERLLVKIILKIINCYDMDEIHTSIRNDDLLSRA